MNNGITYSKVDDIKLADGNIWTPDETVAKYAYTNTYGDKIYYDGISYWAVLKDGSVEWYE